MTTAAIGIVVRCAGRVGGVYDTLRSVTRTARTPCRIALVADPDTPLAAEPWLRAYAAARAFTFLEVDSCRPGAAWNAGLRALGDLRYALCLEAGDVLSDGGLDALAAALDADGDLSWATCGTEWVGPGRRVAFAAPPGGCTPADLLIDPELVHCTSLFRVPQWHALGGFDETMPALEAADLWLRLLEHGTGTVVPDVWLRRQAEPAALHRRTWDDEAQAIASRQLIARHLAKARAAVPSILEARARLGGRVYERHAFARRRNAAARQEIAALESHLDQHRTNAGEWLAHRQSPVSLNWGYERGTPADRPAIERFLAAHALDIRGTVLEVQEPDYTCRFGGDRVGQSDVIDLVAGNPRASIVGDLRSLDHVGDATYDCIILTQTLHVVDEMAAVVRECRRLLKPGGVLLATLPSTSRVCLEYGSEGDFWRVTEAGARRVFASAFAGAEIETVPVGNAVVNAAFTLGMAAEDLRPAVYDTADAYNPSIIGVRATRSSASGGSTTAPARTSRSVVLLYHRVGPATCDPHALAVSVETFRAQMEWLARHCDVIALDQLDRERGHRAVAVTFDDGYLDNLSNAVPLLEREGIPATFFLTTRAIDTTFFYWWDRLAMSLLGAGDIPAQLTLETDGDVLVLATDTRERRTTAHRTLYERVVRLPADRRDDIVTRVWRWAGEPELPAGDRRLTADEVRLLASRPRTRCGAHTVDHLFLPSQDGDVVAQEIERSGQVLTALAGRPVTAFSYPFGAFDDRTVAAARRAGFEVGVTCLDGPVVRHDPLVLPRIEAREEALLSFAARLESAFER